MVRVAGARFLPVRFATKALMSLRRSDAIGRRPKAGRMWFLMWLLYIAIVVGRHCCAATQRGM